MTENELAHEIVDAAFHLHKELGPGLLESVYSSAMSIELGMRGIQHTVDELVPVTYKGIRIEAGFRADLIVEDKVIVELKSVEAIAPVHAKQLQTYLKLTGKQLGLLINFNVRVIKHGITRIVNGLPEANPDIKFLE